MEKESVNNCSEYPLISIVMSTYNGEKYLDQQLQSLIDQDYPTIEILIFDDCSQDGTWKKLENWKGKYPNLISIFQNVHNVGWSLNFANGVEMARGTYIAWCDQDDIWMHQKISTLYQVFQKHNDASLVYHNAYEFSGDNQRIPKKENRFHWDTFEGADPVTLFWQCRILGHRMMFPTSLKNIILPAVDKSYDWWIQVGATAIGKVYYCPEELVAQRLHDSSAVFSHPEDFLKTELRREYLHNFQRFDSFYSDGDRYILHEMSRLMDKHVHGKFDWRLFVFAIKYRYKLFNFLIGGNAATRELFRWRTARAWAKNW